MTQKEIEQIFDDLKEATIEFWEVSKREDEAKIEKISKYKKLQLARQKARGDY